MKRSVSLSRSNTATSACSQCSPCSSHSSTCGTTSTSITCSPRSHFTKPRLKKTGVPDEDIDDFQDMVNGLPNLQLLEGGENIEKLASMPTDWIMKTFKNEANRTNYSKNHLLGDVPESLTDFRKFYDTRREALRTRIVDMVGAKVADAPSA